MKREEEKKPVQETNHSQNKNADITSASVENAHASGDGTVKKSDEALPTEDDSKTSTDTTPY